VRPPKRFTTPLTESRLMPASVAEPQ
jgi:hypothetical protein